MVPVPPGEALIVLVGSPGGIGFVQQPGAGELPGGSDGGFSPGLNGPGGGGGYSGLFTPTSVPLVIGAGGGGGGLSSRFATGGTGDTGSGGATGGVGASGAGGGGGVGAVGSDGGTGGAGSFGGLSGAGGTTLTGGAGGAGASSGGGGGYAAGGGGGGAGRSFGSFDSGGGGGGGSSYGVSGLVNGTSATSASVTIRWTRTTSDLTKPTITITTPPDQATYFLGQDVTADYACADETGGSGLAECVGTVNAGAPIDTATVGAKTFTVTATDNDGNTDTVMHGYTVAWPFGGFVAPINRDAENVLKAGQVAPVRFSLGGDRGLGILAGPPTSRPVQCDTTMLAEPVEETVTAGASGLTYDPATGTYSYAWKTDKAWAGTCRQLTVTFVDGTSHTALFRLTR